MNIEIEVPEGLDPRLTALGWLVGSWEGTGNGTDHSGGDFRFEQRIQFWPGGGGYLYYLSQSYLLTEADKAGEMFEMETGFWHPKSDASVELTLTNSAGWTEVLAGKIQVTRVDLHTDAVMRTKDSAVEYTAGQRLYGKVEGDLMYALDRATVSHELRPHTWARLRRV